MMDKNPVAIQHFLLFFDHQKGQLIREESFGADGQRALDAYQVMEMEHRYDRHIDIVLIGSDSLETVKLTHANYYTGAAAVSKYLIGL
jgi:hypothetical protein